MASSSTRVFDSDVLEYILSFCPTPSLLSSTAVSRRWKEAGRLDSLWMDACERLWSDKVGMPKRSRGGEQGDDSDGDNDGTGSGTGTDDPPPPPLPLYWRSKLSPSAVGRLSVQQMRGYFADRLRSTRDALDRCVEKEEMRNVVLWYLPDTLGGSSSSSSSSSSASASGSSPRRRGGSGLFPSSSLRAFDDIWFASYASSVIDSSRDCITADELCNIDGFDMYFKFVEQDSDSDEDDDEYGGLGDNEPTIKLHYHMKCRFDDNYEFHSYPPPGGLEHPNGLTWRWVSQGRTVQVGPYPPLTVTRLKDWGWKLENVHVALFFRGKGGGAKNYADVVC